VSDDQTVFQIHYRDGRVEGPLGTQVVIDLINAGVIQHDDMLCPPGGHPAPASVWPVFAGLFAGGDDFDDNEATSMMTLDQLTAGFGRELADLADDWGDGSSTVQMDVPASGGLFPVPGRRAPESAPPVRTQLRAAPDLDDAVVNERISVEVDDLFSVAGSTPSGSNIPRRAAPTVGNSYASTSGAFPSSIAVPNPFANRPVRTKPDRSGASVSGQRRRGAGSSTSGSLAGIDPLFKKSAQELRQKLLDMTLFDILGVDAEADDRELVEAHAQRRIALARHADIQNTSIMVRASVHDVIAVIDQAFTLLSTPADKQRYLDAGTQADFPAFRDFATFAYAPVKPLEPGWDPYKHGIPVEPPLDDLDLDENGDASAADSSSLTSQERIAFGGASASMDSLEPGRHNPAALQERPATQSATAQRRPAQPTSPKPTPRTSQPPGNRGKPAPTVSDRRKRLKEFKGSAFQEDGDPFKGPLAFGVGSATRGLLHTIPVFVVVFAICFVLVSVLHLGEFEFQLRPDEKMLYVRGAVLSVMAVLAMLVVRRESPARMGWKPNAVATVLAVPLAFVIAGIASFITPLPLEQESTLPVVLGLIAIRGIAEPLFFQGFLTRTLLIEFREPIAPVVISAIAYGIYTLTYLGIFSGPPAAIVYGVVVWGFGAGLPYAIIYWKSRSVLTVMLCELIVLITVAISSWNDIQSTFVAPG